MLTQEMTIECRSSPVNDVQEFDVVASGGRYIVYHRPSAERFRHRWEVVRWVEGGNARRGYWRTIDPHGKTHEGIRQEIEKLTKAQCN